MKGDFSRFTFDVAKRFTAVLLQQGRVALDSDWNEEGAIRREAERTLAQDLLGAGASPDGDGFAVRPRPDGGLVVCAGRIYVGGLVCTLAKHAPLARLLAAPLAPQPGRTDLVYLDAWERHLTAIDDPELLDPALAGTDTTTRLQVAWRIAAVKQIRARSCEQASAALPTQPSGKMAAAAPDGYLGSENRLYRVEIHDGGPLGRATFKWSRENGSRVLLVEEVFSPRRLAVGAASYPPAEPLAVGDWVEVSDDEREQAGRAGVFARIEQQDGPGVVVFDRDLSIRTDARPRLRKWDQREAPTLTTQTGWTPLENGIQVRFSGDRFRSGDYWTIPAHPAAPRINWPAEKPPAGITHHLCPLALISWNHNGGTPTVHDCRRPFTTLPHLHVELERLRAEIADLRRRPA